MTEEAKTPPSFMSVQLKHPGPLSILRDGTHADANLATIREPLPDAAKAHKQSWLILCPMIVKAIYADQNHPEFEIRKAALTTLGDCFGYRREDARPPR